MQGYYRFPTINKETIIFVCEDDMWIVPVKGGIAQRLTSNLGRVSHCCISPDGEHVAFTGREEGNNEVYCMSLKGGTAKRLTFLGGMMTRVLGWEKDGSRILFASDSKQWHPGVMLIYSVDRNKDIPKIVPVGIANRISLGPKKSVVIGRNNRDPAIWKRYRGGTAGEIWIDQEGKGNFRKLMNIRSNLADPMWIGNRIFFLSDHEGICNIYSCTPAGKNLQRHTSHKDFYVRNAKTDGKNIVYHAGGDIYVYFPGKGIARKVKIDYRSPRVQTQRKFVETSQYLEDYSVHPKGDMVSITSRGKVFSMQNWEGPVTQNGAKANARYRLGRWLNDGKRLVVVTDEKGEDMLQVHTSDGARGAVSFPQIDIGRAIELEPSPKEPVVVLANHRQELILVNLRTKRKIVLDRSKHNRITGLCWSSDGVWIAYSYPDSERTTCIKIANIIDRKTHCVTNTVLNDFAPSFDPDGKYLYFLSNRHFDPVYDTMQFELSFPANIKPYLILLDKELPSPFKYTKNAPVGMEMGIGDMGKELLQPKKAPKKLKIDLDGITDRILSFPVQHGRYFQTCGVKDKALFLNFPITGGKALWFSDELPSNGTLEYYDFKEQKSGVITSGIMNFKVSADAEIIVYRAHGQLRVIKPTEKIEQKLEKGPVGPRSGWVDLARVKVMVEPKVEWRQMYRDAWRLQRDHFWTKNMSGIDWKKVYERYLPMLDRIGTRSEFSDLIWEMQGELGTSHAYEWGGDYRDEPRYTQGFLGADLEYDRRRDAYRIIKIIKGDTWDEPAASPLLTPGANVREGELLVAVNNSNVGRKVQPAELLVNHANNDVLLTIASRGGKKRSFSVKALRDESFARYREWVEKNRKIVHDASKGKIGYVHIPDMGPNGFAEFHRYFLSEIQYPALIVDVRFNRGGHVSELLLEKVARKRIGYCITRWTARPYPYPSESVLGPIVCLTNEYAGSDGDIFSHSFKLAKVGPLIGKRTWGGVIGISPYYYLSDGGLTTQPEYSFWFKDVGWGVENYGTDPDIEVDIKPQDYVRGKDPQLDRGIKECMKLVRKAKPRIPDFGKRPNLKLPERLK